MSKDKLQDLKFRSNQQIDNPDLMIGHFFDCYHLPELKEELWEWFSNAIARENSIYDDGLKRSNLVTLYENIELLIDAAWLIHNRAPNSHL